MNRTFSPFVITAMTASSMSLTGSCRRQVYWSDSSKLVVASDTIAACRDRQQEIRKFLTSLAKILRSSSRRVLRDRVRETCPEIHEHANTNTNSREAIERNEAGGPFSTACGPLTLLDTAIAICCNTVAPLSAE